MDVRLIVGLVVGLAVALGLGIIVGHFALPKDAGDADSFRTRDLGDCTQGCVSEVRPEDIPVVREYLQECVDQSCAAVTCAPPLPAHYIAYHLGDQTITVDGILDDEAWAETPRFTEFTDIYGPAFGGAQQETYAQLRYDDEFLYVAAYFAETDIWANQTDHNSAVWHDNCFEVFLDADWSNHWYKEFQINALETTWDLMLDKPYINGGTNLSWEMPEGEFKVYTDGPVNDPDSPNQYWTIEVKMPFENILENNKAGFPQDKDQWRLQLSRVQYAVDVVDGEYWKRDEPARFWLMQPQYAYNIHLPERWGILMFSEDPVDESVYEPIPEWAEYSVAINTYNAMKTYSTLNGGYEDNDTLLDLPPIAFSGECMLPPEITHDDLSFTARVKPVDGSHRTVVIDHDRFLEFED